MCLPAVPAQLNAEPVYPGLNHFSVFVYPGRLNKQKKWNPFNHANESTAKIIHIGGEKCVTGSCHLLQVKGLNIMVDCGLTQGHDAAAPMDSWPVRPDQVDFLFLTHAHIDHIGRLPELIQKGFKGEIIATHAT